MTRITLKHLSGSRAGQVNEFPLPQTKEITFGRDPQASIPYDPAQDDLVGRYHAKLAPDAVLPGHFTITDLNSRNGTFVNKQRLNGTLRLTPGDVIQLGAGGPEFTFDLSPRPATQLQPTREAGAAGASPSVTMRIFPPTTERTHDPYTTNQTGGRPVMPTPIALRPRQPSARA